MNDFLRPCNCVHPTEDDCEKCVNEAAPEKPAGDSKEGKKPQASAPVVPPTEQPLVRTAAGA